MKVLNEGVNYKKITELSDNSPSDVMSVWEKIKDWFGFSQQKKY